MFDASQTGKLLIIAGASILALGLLLAYGSKFLPLGKLPGDIFIKRGNFTFYFPVVTGIILSLLLTLLLNFFKR